MALIGANELKKKMLIEIEGQPYHVLDVFFATPTARGASTMVRTRLKNLLTGAVQEKSFRTSEKFPEPDVEIAAVSFLYSDSEGFHFMDQSTYEQFMLVEDSVGDDGSVQNSSRSSEALAFLGKDRHARVYDLEERTARFGEAIIDFARTIPQDAVTNRIVNQLVAAGTSVGANYVEADDAVSKKEFLKSIGTCKKETREVKHFLRMTVRAAPELKPQARRLWLEARQLHLIFSKIWRTGKNQ